MDESATKHFFLVQISGIPYVFGNAASYTFAGYTYVPLLMHGGIVEDADSWDLREGTGSAGSCDITLFDQRDSVHEDGWLTWLFASELATAYRSQINEEIPWDPANIAVLDVLDTTGAGASGYLYRGLETLGYDHIGGGTEFHVVTRGEYGSPVLRHMIGGTTEPENWSNPYITDHPMIWEGRYVTIHRADVSEHGVIGDLSVVWRGTLNEVTAAGDADTWTLRCSSLLACLEAKLGRTQAVTELTRPASAEEIFWYLDSDYVNTGSRFMIFQEGVTIGGSVTLRLHSGVLRHINVGGSVPGTPVTDCIWDTWDIATQSGVQVTLQSGVNEEGLLNVSFVNGAASSEDVLIHLPAEFAAALGFDSSDLRVPGDQTPLTADRPISPIFYSSITDRLYVVDKSEIWADVDVGSDAAVAVQMSNDSDNGLAAFRVTGSDTDATDGDYLEVVPIAINQMSMWPVNAEPTAIYCDPDAIPTVVSAMSADNIDFSDALLYCLVSGGGDGDNSAFDALPEWGLAIPHAYIEKASFQSFPGTGIPRHYFQFEPVTLQEMFQADFQLECSMLAMRNGKIALLPLATMSDSSDAIDIVEAECLDLLPRMDLDPAWRVDEVVLGYNYDVQGDEFQVEGEAYLNPAAGARGGGQAATMEIESKSVRLATNISVDTMWVIMADIFNKYGHGAFTMELRVFLFKGYDINPGDTVKVTHSQLRSPALATRGASALCSVLSVTREWWSGGGACTLKLLHIPGMQREHGGLYAPSGRIHAYDNGTGELEIDAHAFSSSDMDADISAFAVGDKVRLFRSSVLDEDDVIDTTISAITGNVMTVDAALAFVGGPIAALDRVRYQEWGAQTAAQHERVSIADSADDLLDGVDPPWYFA